MDLNKISGKLRGVVGEKEIDWKESLFYTVLLMISAFSTFTLFMGQFKGLGLIFAILGVAALDGGFLFWRDRVLESAKNEKQLKIAKAMRTASGLISGYIFSVELLVLSGQNFVDVTTVIDFFGYGITIHELAGGLAMLAITAILVAHWQAHNMWTDADPGVAINMEKRRQINEQKRSQLAVAEATTAAQNEITAASIDALSTSTEQIKEQVAREMAGILTPMIQESVRRLVIGEDVYSRQVIEAKYREPAQPQQPQQYQQVARAPEPPDVLFMPPQQPIRPVHVPQTTEKTNSQIIEEAEKAAGLDTKLNPTQASR